jgi:PAS domain S-box-containing protein
MKSQARNTEGPRIQEILNLIYELASGNLVARGTVSENNDYLDGIITGINMLADEIAQDITKREQVEEELKRSKELSETVMNGITDAVSIINVDDFTIAGVNTAFLQAYNCKEEEIIGKTCYEITHHRSVPCTAPDDVCPLDGVITSGETAVVEHLHHGKDDKKSNIEISAFPIIDEGGRTIQIVHVAKDITKRRRAEEVVKESEEKFARAFHSNPHPMSIVTLEEGRYMDVNDSYVQTFGFSREELLGRTTVEMGILKNNRARRKILQSLKERQTVKNLELEFYTRSGRKVDALLFGDKVEIGSQTCLLSVITDITKRKQAEEKRIQLIQELQETLKEVRTLSGLLPICAWCKKLRDDEGYWKSVEQYIGERTKAKFTHGMCPECQSKFLSERNSNTKVS